MREYSLTYDEGLGRGLRNSRHSARNLKWLVECVGAVPRDGVLQALEELPTPISVTGEVWPYPQVFHLMLRTLVCASTAIYEYEGGSLTLMLGGISEGATWSVADFGEYIVLSNGQVIVERDPQSGAYAIQTSGAIPVGICVCNLNGQLIVGAPDVSVSAGFCGV
jgi:hypothetical protein